ncbi:chaoptin-like [Artemia franciscana]|uniref:chaoptin-like n=1 Tax=Artemia franciscana TaxID=6661 RepID=UPI0032DBCCAA
MGLEPFHIERLSFVVLLVSFLFMTAAYLVGASDSENRYPPCPFNPLCRCSNAGPDLGVVVCENFPLADIPVTINMTKVFTFRMKRNNLRQLKPNRFHGTGVYKVSICHNYLNDIPKDAWNGLERSLWELDIQYNLLQRIPQESLKDLQKLKVLDLTGNEINEIYKNDFEGVEDSLQTLVLAENSLTSIQQDVLQNLMRLEKLDLSGNNIVHISDLAFEKGPKSLSHLNLANNLLNKIPFTPLADLKSLHTVDLAHNKIHETFDVFYQGQLSLDTIILDHNNIQKLIGFSFQNFGNLNKTSLESNPINYIDDDAFKEAKIREISLKDCYISQLAPRAFRGLETSLQKLDLGFNNLTVLPDNLFDNFDYLKSLSFNDNELSFNPEESFNGFRYTLQSLNLVGHKMGNVNIKELNHMRNLRSIGLSTLPDENLSKEDFEGFGPALDSLYLPRNKIKSIQANAFQYIPGLKTLDLSENNIATIDNEAFRDVGTSLRTLYLTNGLSSTKLVRDGFQALVNLQKLDMSNNRIVSIPQDFFHSMRDLEDLRLHDNKLGALKGQTFSPNMTPNLKFLTLSFNEIKLIESQAFSDLQKLKKLFLDDNQIVRIGRNSFQNLDNLEVLNLEGNKVDFIAHEAFQNLPKLEELNLAYNELKNFDIDILDQVGTLATLNIDLSHNSIVNLTTNGSSWSSNSNVKILDFSQNNISFIADSYFDPIRSSLTHLIFSNNQLKNISDSILRNMPHLVWLDLSKNRISNISPDSFANTKKLQYIDISNNNLEDIASDIFANHPFLRVINLSGNKIQVIPENLLKDTVIEFFDGSRNQLIKFPDQTLSKVAQTLLHLDLSNNDIRSLSPSMFNPLVNLVYLDLSNNEFQTIPESAFSRLDSLVTLDLSHNPLQGSYHSSINSLQSSLRNLSLANTSLATLPELYVPNLLYFNVSNNRITYLSPTILETYASLRSFDVSHCEIPSAANTAWHTIPRLRRLYLDGNKINSITNDTFIGLDRVEELNLIHLPLQTFQYGALAPLSSLRIFRGSIYKDVRGFSIASLVRHNSALRSLYIDVEDSILDKQLHGVLPQKLGNITITGKSLKSFGKSPFKDLSSRCLQLHITNTSLQNIERSVFKDMGATKWLKLDVTGNNLKQMAEPYTTLYPGSPYSTFLLELEISGNEWNCDCAIGWVEYWMKKWRQHDFALEQEHEILENHQKQKRDFRMSECRNKGNASFIEVLKTDLECGWSSSSNLTSHLPFIVFISVFTHLICKYF